MRKTFFKKIIVGTLAFTIVPLLAVCSSAEEPSEASSSTSVTSEEGSLSSVSLSYTESVSEVVSSESSALEESEESSSLEESIKEAEDVELPEVDY